MSKTTLTNRRQLKPGEFVTVLGEEITVVPSNDGCEGCVSTRTHMCFDYPNCTDVIFVTYDEYIKRRLKGEL